MDNNISVKKERPQLLCKINENCSKFLHVEGSTSWQYDCPQFFFLRVYDPDISFCRISFYQQNTVMFFDFITRQTINCATPLFCHNNLQSVVALDFDNFKQFSTTRQPVLRASPKLCEPNQI